jgi:flagellar hook-associated protein 2
MNKTIKNLKTMLEDEEQRYWNKFTALETAMSSMNNQSSMLTSFSAG